MTDSSAGSPGHGEARAPRPASRAAPPASRSARPSLRAAARGRVLRGTVWPGGAAEPAPGVVVIDGEGKVARIAFGADAAAEPGPPDLPVLGDPTSWVGPGVIDSHVHLALSDPAACLAGGVVAVRDLGAPAQLATAWRSGPQGGLAVRAAGPMLTAAGGYPTDSWGAGLGLAAYADDPSRARDVVRQLARRGVDAIKVMIDPGDRAAPTLGRRAILEIVRAAHEHGLPVIAHALTVRMVRRAVDSGVDELAHTPTERLPDDLIEQLVAAGIGVASTLQAFFSQGAGADAGANAAAIVRAGGVLRYGTDLGNTGTAPGVDPRELDRLAQAGLGRLGALRCATQDAAAAVGMGGPASGVTGVLRVGEPARAVVLDGDPLREPAVWRAPLGVVVGRRAFGPAHRR